MSDTIIKVEGLGKKYIITHEGRESYTALRDVISRKAKKIAGLHKHTQRSKEEFWALKDIDFEIKRGEAVGIIGRNGAGKSTLLKILSRITEPTTGRIELNGRVASLLEVGTGFHPELTGRENIFLNGAILGMSQAEIKRKFDEIVDFSGVEKFLDTPVKRYSSGMYVRLAFSVAAHLEPEILVVDEVLAVGDAEFQKKCLGKMKSVSSEEGRTIIFVSHDINAIINLTQACILLKDGQVASYGNTIEVVQNYIDIARESSFVLEHEQKDVPCIKEVNLQTSEKNNIQYFNAPISLTIRINIPSPLDTIEFAFQIYKTDIQRPIIYNWFSAKDQLSSLKGKTGDIIIKLKINKLKLYVGQYNFSFFLSDPRGKVLYHKLESKLFFEVQMFGIDNEWGWAKDACYYIEDCTLNILHHE